MDELRDRFAALDRVAVPDLWPDIDRRVGAAAAGSPVHGQVTWRGEPAPFRLSPTLILLLLSLLLTLALAFATAGSWLPNLLTSVVPLPPPSVPTERIAVPPGGGFVPAGSMSDMGCYWCHAVVLNDGRVLVVGDIGQIYDPATWTFAPVEGLPSPGPAVLLDDGRVLLSSMNEIALYDPATGTSEVIENPFSVDKAAERMADGRVLLVGADLIFGMENPGAGLAVTFDPRTDTLTATGQTIAQRLDGVQLAPLDDGRVLVVGGSTDGSAELYDPATGTFSATGGMNSVRWSFTATRLLDGRVLIVGGSSETETLASAEIYDPASGTFTLTGSMETPRYWHAAALLPDGRVLVVGGATDGVRLDQGTFTEIYDPQTGQFARGPATQQPRVGATAVSLPQGVLVLGHYAGNVGGNDAAGRTAEVFTLGPVDRPVGCCLDTPGFISVSATAPAAARRAFLSVPSGALAGASRATTALSWDVADGGSGSGADLFIPSCDDGCSIPISISSVSSGPPSAVLTVTVDITYEEPAPPQAADIEIVFFEEDGSD
jgi:WD40 repeat protein